MNEGQNDQQGQQTPDPNLGKANTPAATPGHPTTDPHGDRKHAREE